MQKLISILIPVYNLEKYIANCLDSLLAQTNGNFEIICVDDGSTDGSADIIKAYSANDSRVKYIFKENGGVSSARNMALDNAKGDYIMFVDGDDYLHPQALELFLNCAEETDAEVVCADYKRTKKTDESMLPIETAAYSKVCFEKIFLDKRGLQLGETVWGKLIKAELCDGIRFHTDLQYSEDTLFTVELFRKVNNIYFISSQLYYYLVRTDSAVGITYGRKRLTTLVSYDRMCEITKNCDNGVLRFFCLKGLFKYIRYTRMKTRFSKLSREARRECRKLGNKWLGALIREPSASALQKMQIVFFYFSQLSHELALLIKEPKSSWKIYRRRWKDRKNTL